MILPFFLEAPRRSISVLSILTWQWLLITSRLKIRMDYNGFQARLKDLKAAEMAALRRGDKEAADRVSLRILIF